MSWSVLYDLADEEVHVIPNGDLVDPDLDGDCACQPTPEVRRRIGGDGWLYVHHSLDGRELAEGGTP